MNRAINRALSGGFCHKDRLNPAEMRLGVGVRWCPLAPSKVGPGPSARNFGLIWTVNYFKQ